MKHAMINVQGNTVKLTIHSIDGEVSEVYASWDDMEIAFAYDIEECLEKINQFFGVE